LTKVGSGITKAAILFFGNSPDPAGGQTYQSVRTGWGSIEVWFLLVAFYWIVFPVAGLTWVWKVKRIVVDRDDPERAELFLLILFAAFSIQFVSTIIIDQLGVFFGSNTQIRVLPVVGIMAVVFATRGFQLGYQALSTDAIPRLSDQQARVLRGTYVVVLLVLLLGFTGAGVIKASSSPYVTGNWIFVTEGETDAVGWIEREGSEQIIWAGYNERVTAGTKTRAANMDSDNVYDMQYVDYGVNYVLESRTVTALAHREGLPRPPTGGASKVYANGDASLHWFEDFKPMHEYNDALAGR
jgi:hypothetical protein